MKKGILFISFLLLLAIIIATYYVLNNINALVKLAIEEYGSAAVKTAVHVERVNVDLKQGLAGVYGLQIDNPQGFDSPHVLSLGEASIQIDLATITSDSIVIKDITVNQMSVNYEINADKEMNLTVLQNNLASSGSNDADQTDEEAVSESALKMIIRRVTFSQGTLQAKLTPLKKDYNITMPDIILKELGAPQGATPEMLGQELLGELLAKIRQEVKKQGFTAELKEKLQSKKSEISNKAANKREQLKDKAKDKLKSLF